MNWTSFLRQLVCNSEIINISLPPDYLPPEYLHPGLHCVFKLFYSVLCWCVHVLNIYVTAQIHQTTARLLRLIALCTILYSTFSITPQYMRWCLTWRLRYCEAYSVMWRVTSIELQPTRQPVSQHAPIILIIGNPLVMCPRVSPLRQILD